VITTAKFNILTLDMPIYVRHIDIPPMGKQVRQIFAHRA
jgi:hypothetical protein